MASNSFAKMKRKSAPEPDMTEGAAGLWARSLHASFIGNSPVKSPAMQGQGFFAVDPQITPAIGTPEEAFTPPALRNREHSNPAVTLYGSPATTGMNSAQASPVTTLPSSFEAQARLVRESRAQNWQMMSPRPVKLEPVSPQPERFDLKTLWGDVKIEDQRDQKRTPGLKINTEEFVCSICFMFVYEEQGLTLRKCNHSFCRPCVFEVIMNRKSLTVVCPMTAIKCDETLLHEEILDLIGPDSYKAFIKLDQQLTQDQLNTTTVPRLLELENHDYVENQHVFNCAICLTDIEAGSGIMLKNCLHEYCKDCLGRHIAASDELEIPCSFVAEDGTHCEGFLQDREFRSLVDERVYAAHLMKSIERAEASIKDSFHCKNPDCPGWAEISDLVTEFRCPVCRKVSCVKCKVIHEGKTCLEYFYSTNEGARKIRDDQQTEAQLQGLIKTKKAMKCPGCGVVIQKNQGCNHMTCKICKREFQWHGLP